MFWKSFWSFMDHLSKLAFLLLSVVIIVTLLNGSQLRLSETDYNLKLEKVEADMKDVASNNLNYLENRLNRLQEGQDSYKITTSRENRLLEERVTKVETQIAKSPIAAPGIVNTNTLTIGGPVPAQPKQ